METIEQTKLDVEAASFIKDTLGKGKTLSKLLLASHEIASGSVYTFLPADTSTETANDFAGGGKLPPLPAETHEHFTSEDGAKWRMVPVPNADADIVTTIQNFLRAEQGHVCIFEDAVAKPTDLWLSSAGTRVLTFNDEVYHWLSQDDVETTKILNTIRRANSWLFMGAMTSTLKIKGFASDAGTISYDALKTMAEETKIIVVGAYDGEGYLIWSK